MHTGRFRSPPVLSPLLLLTLLTISSSGSPDLSASKRYEGSSEFVHLSYHMGPVLTGTITIHPIWYGRWAPHQKRILRAFIQSISAHPGSTRHPSVAGWWSTVRLYSDQTGSNVTRTVRLGQEKNDRMCSQGKKLDRMKVQRVIKTAITARTRPLAVNPRGGMYLVLTAADVEMDNFCGGQVCGFHYFTFPSIVGYTMPFAWIGNSAIQCPGICAYPFAIPQFPGNPPRAPETPPNDDIGVDGMVSVLAHELAEVASNPLVNAWYAGGDPVAPTEIADLCLGIYGTGGGGSYTGQLLADESGAAYNVNGVGGRRFLVQWVWDPVVGYCSGPNKLD